MKRVITTVAAGIVAAALAMPAAALAKNSHSKGGSGASGTNGGNGVGNGGLPNGKPFQALEQQIQTLQGQVTTLQQQLQTAQNEITALQNVINSPSAQNAFAFGHYVTVDTTDPSIDGLAGPNIILTGANLHLRNGEGSTTSANGLGNLVLGYDEDAVDPSTIDANRTGSHNLIVGPDHQFTSTAGIVSGFNNTISATYASVVGGEQNTASGYATSVSGGSCNTAGPSLIAATCVPSQSAEAAVVSGGTGNLASGQNASVGGGTAQTESTNGTNLN